MMTDALNSIGNDTRINDSYNNNSTKDSNVTDGTISIDGYINLFVESLKNQDPLQPMSNQEMMEQISQITQMQNTMNMQTILENLAASLKGQNPIGNYLDLIGKSVQVETDSGKVQGTVLSVGKSGDDILFELEDGQSYYVSQITAAADY